MAADVRAAILVAVMAAGLVGAFVGWHTRSRFAPAEEPKRRDRWSLVAAAVVGVALTSVPDALAVIALSGLAGFLLVCSVVVARHLGQQLRVPR